jgi:hypothetical protein
MLQHTLRGWRNRYFWLLLFLSLVVLFCVYRIILPLPIFINLGTEGDERYLLNFHHKEQGELYPFRWTKDASFIKIPNLGSLSLEIILGADAARPEGQPLPRVSLIANGTVLADFTMQNGIGAHQFLYYPPLIPLPKDLLLEVKADTFVSPGDEYRVLGILLNTVEIKPTISPLRLFQVSLVASLIGALSIAFSYLFLCWLGVSQKKSFACGMVVLALLGLGIVRRFIVARFLIGFWGLLLAGYVVVILLETRGYKELWMPSKTWADRNYYQKLLRGYKALALMLLNTCVFLLVLNVGLFVILEIQGHFFDVKESNPISRKYNNLSLKRVYPDLSEQAIDDLLTETWSRPCVYESFTQFKERAYSGDYVNVDENGFRITKNQGPWPPDPDKFNVFLFGGSTTFGYGVPDDQTIASYLQEVLSNKLERDVRVYNFGRGHYYSTQELVLLKRLSVAGFIPDMAIFVDGLNEFYYYDDEPYCTECRERFFNGTAQVSPELELLNKLPMTRVANSLKDQVKKILTKRGDIAVQNEQEEIFFDEDIYNDEVIISNVANRYIDNQKIIDSIAAVHSIQPIFVWQPIPIYKYDLDYHLFVAGGFGQTSYSRYGYQYMAELVKEKPLGDNFLWCADMQEHLQKPLYVDKYHYSAEMSKMLAVTIADLLLERNLLVIGAQ